MLGQMRISNRSIELLRKGQTTFPPFSIQVQKSPFVKNGLELDALVKLTWEGTSYLFGLAAKSNSTPRAIKEAIEKVKRAPQVNLSPLILVPYLSNERLDELEAQGVSGIDQCGNGVVIIPPKILVKKSGAPNRFRFSPRLKNVYSGTTSLVPRVFLSAQSFDSVQAIQTEIRARGATVALSTVSKALKILEEDLIIDRSRGRIRLLQAEILLNKLVEHGRLPNVSKRLTGKIKQEGVMLGLLQKQANRKNLRFALTGSGSVLYYAAMAQGEIIKAYCDDVDALLEEVGFEETRTFPTVELFETNDMLAYFDVEYRDGFPIASQLQTYLELMKGDKRDQQTAVQLRERILSRLPK